MEPVGEVHRARPDLSHVRLNSVEVLDKNVHLNALVVGVVSLGPIPGRVNGKDSRINNGDEFLSIFMELINKRGNVRGGEISFVVSEIQPQVHVVNVQPGNVEGDGRILVSSNDVNGLLQILVTIPALVEPKRPVGLKPREADNLLVLRSHIGGAGTNEGVKVDNTTEGLERERVPAFRVRHVNSITVPQEASMGRAIRTKLEVEGMGGVKVGVKHCGRHVPCPHCCFTSRRDFSTAAPALLPKTKDLATRIHRGG
mmetsp:Transcript_17633/g.36589  ORF Transcript_17633/g.36589 Transcript_17633/m.36589 type:complete len:256 (+) Transcript_17633:1475-2242(+)